MTALHRLFLGAICIAFAPIFVKAASLSPTAAGIYRCLFGAAAFLIYFFIFRKTSPLITRMNILLWLGLAGLIFALDLTVWHRSVVFSGAGMATILGNTQVFYVGLIGILFLNERPSLKYFLGVALGFIGICLLVGFDTQASGSEFFYWGVFYGLLTGVVYSLYIFCLRHIEKNHSDISTGLRMAYISIFSCLVLSVIAVPLNEFEGLYGIDWFYMIALGVVAQFAGWFIITKNLPHVDISKAGLIILTQPVLATIMGALFFSEKLGAIQILGGMITLVGIYLGTIRKKA